MPAPLVTAALIGAGASLLGGAISSRSARDQAQENTAYQREFAQHGIRWRVEDAKAAGLHPLSAIGAITPSYQPQTYVDPMGQSIAAAGQDLSKIPGARERQYMQDKIDLVQFDTLKAVNEKERAIADRERALNRRLFEYNPDGLPTGNIYPQTFDRYFGLESQLDASRVGLDTAPYVTSTPSRPMFDRYNTTWGEMLLMTSQEGPTESFDVGLDGRVLTIQANMQYYGPQWLDKMLQKGPAWIRKTVKDAGEDAFSLGAITKALEYFKANGKAPPALNYEVLPP